MNRKLLPESVLRTLPPLYSQDGKGLAALAVVKFFVPWNGWTWFASEASPVNEDGDVVPLGSPATVDVRFFGLVQGQEEELGYWHLSDLYGVTGPGGLGIERDLHWTPKPLSECQR